MNANKKEALAARIEAVDALADRKRREGQIHAANRAVGRAEGLREARDLMDEPETIALTPEVVLRAMLTANEAAALDRAIAHMKAPLYSEYESLSSDEADSRAAHMRDVFASFIAGLDWRALLSPEQEDDYEARLAGTRPLDAPPPEVS